ncbi:MAG: translocation/assembly module TamB domain-containing protein [Myxococcota bacterium]
MSPRRLLRALGVGAVSLVVAAGSIGGWVRSERGSTWLAKRIEHQLDGFAAGSLTLGTARVGLSQLVVEDLRVHGPNHADLLVVPRLEATFDATALWQRRLVVHDLVVQRPRVLLRRTDTGYDLPTFAPSAPRKGAMRYLPEGWTAEVRLRIVDAEVALPDDGVCAVAGHLDMAWAAGSDRLELRQGSVATTLADPPVGEVSAEVTVGFYGSDVVSSKVDLRVASGLRMSVEGAVPDALGAVPEIDLEGTAWSQREGLNTLAEALGTPLPALDVRGLGVRLTADGPLSTPLIGVQAFTAPARTDAIATARAEVAAWQPLAVNLAFAVPALRELQGFGVPLDSGTATGRGTLQDTTLQIDAEVQGLGVAGITAGRLMADAQVALTSPLRTEVRVTSDDVEFGGRAWRVLADGIAWGETLQLGLDVADRSAPDHRVEAVLDIDVAHTQVRAAGLTVHGGPKAVWDQFDESWFDWKAASAHADLRGSVGRMAVDGRFHRAWPEVAVVVDDLDLGAAADVLAPFFAEPLPRMAGRLSAQLEGPAWSFEVEDLSVEDRLVDVVVKGRGTLTPQQMQGQGTLADARGIVAQTTLRLPLRTSGGPQALTLDCESSDASVDLVVPKRGLNHLVTTFPALNRLDTDVEVAADVVLRGDPCDPVVQAEFTGRPDTPDLDLEIRMEVADGPDHVTRATLVGTLEGVEHAHVEGTAVHASPAALLERGRAAVGAVSVDLDLDDWPTVMVLPQAPGWLRGQATLTGTGTRLQHTEGRIVYAPLSQAAPLPTTELLLSTEADHVVASVTLEDREGIAASAPVVAEPQIVASVRLDAMAEQGLSAPLDATIQELRFAVADLATLAEVDARKAMGALWIDGTVGGTLRDPVPALRAELVGGGGALPALGVRFDDAHVVAALKGRTLTVHEGSLRSRPRFRNLRQRGRGMTVRGTVTLDSSGKSVPDLRLTLDRSWLLASRDVTLQASGEVSLTRNDARLALGGEVRLDEGRVLLDRATFADGGSRTLHPDIVFEDAVPATLVHQVEATDVSALPDVDVDLAIDLGDGVDLEATVPLSEEADAVGRAFDVAIDGRLEGSMRVTQVDGALDLRGRLNTTGRVELISARFDITEGVVAFAGGDLTEPSLDVSLERPTKNYGTVMARVQGSPSNLELSDLTSDEAADQTDIVAILLFGRPLSEVDPQSGEAGAGAVEQALWSLAGRQVEQVLGGRFFDTVNYTADEGLSVGVAVGRGGFLTVSVDPLADDDENAATARLTWLLTRRVETGIESGDQGTSSGWLVWRRRF